MANEKFAKVTPYECKRNEFATAFTSTGLFTACATNGASSASYGCYFECNDLGEKYAIAIQNAEASDAKDVTIKAGNAIQAMGDLVLTDLAAGKTTYLTIDNGRYLNVAPNATIKALSANAETDQIDPKGKIFIVGESANIKVAVFKLP